MAHTQKSYRQPIEVIDNLWIPLSDGVKLAAKVWMPSNAKEKPVPAILEYLPYRKNDGTLYRDEPMHSYFAANNYAAVRVDIRGSGDSDGLLLDEYTLQEQQDALEVISWLAKQDWCTGSVGMMGISWGGFNSLQVAALKPPALKAIVSVCSTDDRYTDDCHYMGGCVLGSDMLNWASIMLAYNGLPPDPENVGDNWRDIWFNRLENTPPFIEKWLSHQFRDDYWKQGSVIECYDSIECAVYVVGGWVDPYTNSIPRLLEGLSSPRKGLIGPWGHQYPDQGVPAPAIGFLQECIRWWDYWLKGIDNGIMDEPQLRAYIPEAVPPRAHEAEWPGDWVAEESWPPENGYQCDFYLTGNKLTEKPDFLATEEPLIFKGSQLTGLTAGVWCPYGNLFGQPIEQKYDDSASICYTSEPAGDSTDILGFPVVNLSVAFDKPNALLAIRLCDVSPNGDSRLVSWGLLNITHRFSHENLVAVKPGEKMNLSVKLNFAGHRLVKGHRWRLVISPTYWPHAWPSPEVVEMTLFNGEENRLILPVRPSKSSDVNLPTFALPEQGTPLDSVWLRHSDSSRLVQYDVVSGQLKIIDKVDDGRLLINKTKLVYDNCLENIYSIIEGKPLSAKVECTRHIEISRGQWITRVETASVMTSDEEHFHLANTIDAYEGEKRVFTKSSSMKIPRISV